MSNLQRSVCSAPQNDETEERPAVAAEAFRVELRLARVPLAPGRDLPRSARVGDLVEFLFDLVREEPVEVFGAVYLDNKSRPLGYTMPYRGTTNSVGPEARHLLLKAWGCQARSMVVFHNHPGGGAHASNSDIDWTRSLLALSVPLGIEVRDHIILAEEPTYFSMANDGTVPGLGRRPRDIWSWKHEAERIAAAERRIRRQRRRARPKYRDPQTGKTWAGRGTMAKWLQKRLEQGFELEDFRIRSDEPESFPNLD